jgi:hypothetical protein
MSRVRVHNFSVSLDGFGTGEGQSLDAPFGHAGTRLHEWFSPPGASMPCKASPAAVAVWTMRLPPPGGRASARIHRRQPHRGPAAGAAGRSRAGRPDRRRPI